MYCIDSDMHTTQLLLITYSNNNINRKPLQKSIILIIRLPTTATSKNKNNCPASRSAFLLDHWSAKRLSGWRRSDSMASCIRCLGLERQAASNESYKMIWYTSMFHDSWYIYICIHIEIIYANRFLASWCMYVPLDQPIKVMCGVPIFRHLLDVFHQRDRPRWRCWPKISSEAYQGNDERAVSARISGPWAPKAAPRYL